MLHSKSNKDILKALDKVVYGHTEAKKTLINLINRVRMRHYQKYLSSNPVGEDSLVETRNCFLVGPSGTGKTHLIISAAIECDVPLIMFDATQLTPTGNNEGINEKKMIDQIINKAKEYMERQPELYPSLEGTLDRMIVYIDEMDKLGVSFDSSGNWNKHVQSNFLKIIEGHTRVGQLTFVFSGAFSDSDIYEHNQPSHIGFTHNNLEQAANSDLEEKIIKAGMIPELVGRISDIVLLDKFEEEDYRRILHTLVLTKANKDLQAFGLHSIVLEKEEEQAVIDRAIKSHQGVRSLTKQVGVISRDLEFNYEDEPAKLTLNNGE